MNSKIILPKYTWVLSIIYFFALSMSIVMAKSVFMLIPTVIEIIIVLFYIIRLDLRRAVFLHLLFIVLCFDVTTGLGNESVIYSYYKLKAIGLIGFNQIIGIILYLLVLLKYPKLHKNGILYQAYRVFKYLAFIGVFWGVLGICFFSYNYKGTITPCIYIINAIIYTEILLRLYNPGYLRLYLIT